MIMSFKAVHLEPLIPPLAKTKEVKLTQCPLGDFRRNFKKIQQQLLETFLQLCSGYMSKRRLPHQMPNLKQYRLGHCVYWLL